MLPFRTKFSLKGTMHSLKMTQDDHWSTAVRQNSHWRSTMINKPTWHFVIGKPKNCGLLFMSNCILLNCCKVLQRVAAVWTPWSLADPAPPAKSGSYLLQKSAVPPMCRLATPPPPVSQRLLPCREGTPTLLATRGHFTALYSTALFEPISSALGFISRLWQIREFTHRVFKWSVQIDITLVPFEYSVSVLWPAIGLSIHMVVDTYLCDGAFEAAYSVRP